MSSAKTLAVGLAIVTILGMTVALAVPFGPSFMDDDPPSSGVTSAQDAPGQNGTDNGTSNGTDDSTNGGDSSPDTDNDGDDDDPSDSGGQSCGDSEATPTPTPTETEEDDDSSSCSGGGDGDSGNGDGDGGSGDGDGDSGNGDGDSGNGDGGAGGGETPGTCTTGGLQGENGTIAYQAFGTENESGPFSSQIHSNEEQFQDAQVIVHEGSCVIATVDNNANSGGNGSDDGGNGNGSDDGGDGSGGSGEDGSGGAESTCTTGGLQGATVANQAFGTENESGPISSQIHANEEQFQDAQVVVHEGSCVIATVDNNANSGGNGSDDGGNGNGSDDGGDGSGGSGEDGSGGTASTCTVGGLQGSTIAYQAFGTENESGPISSQIHSNEEQFQDAQVVVHEGSCVIATVDNNAQQQDATVEQDAEQQDAEQQDAEQQDTTVEQDAEQQDAEQQDAEQQDASVDENDSGQDASAP